MQILSRSPTFFPLSLSLSLFLPLLPLLLFLLHASLRCTRNPTLFLVLSTPSPRYHPRFLSFYLYIIHTYIPVIYNIQSVWKSRGQSLGACKTLFAMCEIQCRSFPPPLTSSLLRDTILVSRFYSCFSFYHCIIHTVLLTTWRFLVHTFHDFMEICLFRERRRSRFFFGLHGWIISSHRTYSGPLFRMLHDQFGTTKPPVHGMYFLRFSPFFDSRRLTTPCSDDTNVVTGCDLVRCPLLDAAWMRITV